MSNSWLVFAGRVVDEESSRQADEVLGTYRDVVEAVASVVNGRKWLAPLSARNLSITVYPVDDEVILVKSASKFDGDSYSLVTHIAMGQFADLGTKEIPYALFTHTLQILEEFGRKKKLGPPPLRLRGGAAPPAPEPAPEPTEPPPITVLDHLGDDEYLIARRLPAGMTPAQAPEVLKSFEEGFTELVGETTADQLIDATIGADVVTWVVPAAPRG